MFMLRPYQQEALDAVITDIRTSKDVLLQAATGAGKTIMFSALIQYLRLHYPSLRIGVLAHREQLVRQARDKLLSVWPEGEEEIGIACSSVSSDVDLTKPVIIGSPQTLINRLCIPELNLLIVDECHRLPPRNAESQYNILIAALRTIYPKMRLIGVTATPYRLNHGYIYGNYQTKGENWFQKLSYTIPIKTLQEQGYLCSLRAFAPEGDIDLSGIKKTGGDFKIDEIGEFMSSELHVGSAVKAVQKYAPDRQHIVVFACTIEHAKLLSHAFQDAGFDAEYVHCKQPQNKRLQTLQDFDEGRLRVICNVGVLTEGWDCTAVDCMVMCRPTLSAALFVQMVGRGLRTNPEKKDCVLLDLSGNYLRHGDLDNPALPDVDARSAKRKNRELEGEDDRTQICPNCHAIIQAKTLICPECKTLLKMVNNEEKPLCEISDWQVGSKSRQEKPFKAQIRSATIEPYISRQGNALIRFQLACVPEGSNREIYVSHYWDIEGTTRSNRFHKKALQEWDAMTDGASPPETLEETLDRLSEIRVPSTAMITLKQNKYYNVYSWGA